MAVLTGLDVYLSQVSEVDIASLVDAILPLQTLNENDQRAWGFVRSWILSRYVNERGHLFGTRTPGATERRLHEPSFYVKMEEDDDGEIEATLYFYSGQQGEDWLEVSASSLGAAADSIQRETRFDTINVTKVIAGTPTTEYMRYIVGNQPGETFVAKFYGSISERVDESELPEDEQPTDVTFDPEIPLQEEGTHIVGITYTPSSERTDNIVFVEVYTE